MSSRWLFVAALACNHREAPGPAKTEPERAATQGQEEPAATDDVAVATQWLGALRDSDQAKLTFLTRFPLQLHEPNGPCGDLAVPNAEGLANATACLTRDEDFVALLRGNAPLSIESLGDAQLRDWEQRWHVTTALHRVVTVFARSGSPVELSMALVGGGVREIWKDGAAGSTAIKFATDWLDAVRHRDLERLARATAYPLELRDTRRGASCGDRRASARADLPKVIECLFQNDELHRALTDTPTSGFITYAPNSPRPAWIEPWWHDGEHAGLQRVMTMVATVDGYEYNFQMLTAPDGVRVVWKLGAFESRE